jgi:hypothetical protein
MRFRNRFIWITGRLLHTKPICLSLPCPTSKPCCKPCHARPLLGQPPFSIPLEGIIPHHETGKPVRVGCRGNTCGMSCQPKYVGRFYSFAGKPRIRTVIHPKTKQLSFRLESFLVHRFCIHHKPPKHTRPFRLPDPNTQKQTAP